MFFIFNSKIFYSFINIFIIKNIFDYSFYIVFDQSSAFLALFLVLSIIGLMVSNILMFFTKWGTVFPIFIFITDIIYQLYQIINISDHSHNHLYILGIISELIAIGLMIIYFIKSNKTKNNSIF